MKNKISLICTLIFSLFLVASCKQSYNPPALSTNKNYLVVDGFINAGSDSTVFTLTRTNSLDSTAPPVTENGAQLIVEGDKGYTNQLSPLGNGRYGINTLNLDISQKYRMRIITSIGSIYVSDFISVKSSPPIDSISWQRSDSAIHLNLNTHDPLNNTRYYRWNYTETWEFHSPYFSFVLFNPLDSSITFSNDTTIRKCWRSQSSTNILIASTAKLSQDIVSQEPLVTIPVTSEKINVKYSILVRQFALTTDEYNYWETLKNSTEQTGTLFDQQPTQITGNIHCLTNPREPVIGYIGTGAVAETRVFITTDQVSPWFFTSGCKSLTISMDSIPYYYFMFNLIPVSSTLPPGSYIIVADSCVDCRIGGRSNVKPSFWQ